MSGSANLDASLDELMAAVESAGLGPMLSPPAEIAVEDEELAELEALAEESTQETVEGGAEMPRPVEALTDEALEELAEEISHEETKQAIYADAEAGTEIAAPESVEPATPAVKKPRASGGGLVPRKARYGAGTAGDYVAAVIGDEEIKTIVDGLPKKVKDKAANLVDHIKGGKALSVYTQTAVTMLREKGSVTSAALVAAYQAQSKRSGGEGYSIGTARSQAGQQNALLRGFGVIKADGTLNAGNRFAEALGL